MRYLVMMYVEKFQKGEVIKLQRLYGSIYAQFPDACERLGFTASKTTEKKWRNQIRLGLMDASTKGLIKHVGTQKSGTYQRL
jgi:hypothetical protein